MNRASPLRVACIATGERAPYLPAGYAPAGAEFRAWTLAAFLAALDAGAEAPDAVLAFDGRRVAAALRGHPRGARLTILAFGAPGAPTPPGCDGVTALWDERAEALARARAAAAAPAADGRAPAPALRSRPRDRRRLGWAALVLAAFAAAVAWDGGLLGRHTAETVDGRAAERGGLVLAPPRAGPPRSAAAEQAGAPKESAPPPASPEPSHLLAEAEVHRASEVLAAPRPGVLRRGLAQGAGFAAGDPLGVLEPAPGAARQRARALAEAREREQRSAERYERRRMLAREGVLTWEEVAPDWRALEEARAALERAEQAAADPAAAAEPLELRAAAAGGRLEWLVAHGAEVAEGEPLARFDAGEAWCEVRLAAGERAAASDPARAEARLGGGWLALSLLSESPLPDGGTLLRFALPAAAAGPPPERVAVRWPAAAPL